jgi:hypothetical protein
MMHNSIHMQRCNSAAGRSSSALKMMCAVHHAPVKVGCGALVVRLVIAQQQRHKDARDDDVAQPQHAAGQ